MVDAINLVSYCVFYFILNALTIYIFEIGGERFSFFSTVLSTQFSLGRENSRLIKISRKMALKTVNVYYCHASYGGRPVGERPDQCRKPFGKVFLIFAEVCRHANVNQWQMIINCYVGLQLKCQFERFVGGKSLVDANTVRQVTTVRFGRP